MKVSVIIVNYNVWYFLDVAIDSVLRAMNGIDGEIIVVDNASSDDSCSLLKKKYPQVRLIANDHNAGFSKANNREWL